MQRLSVNNFVQCAAVADSTSHCRLLRNQKKRSAQNKVDKHPSGINGRVTDGQKIPNIFATVIKYLFEGQSLKGATALLALFAPTPQHVAWNCHAFIVTAQLFSFCLSCQVRNLESSCGGPLHGAPCRVPFHGPCPAPCGPPC